MDVVKEDNQINMENLSAIEKKPNIKKIKKTGL
jgi:hypothetical protein